VRFWQLCRKRILPAGIPAPVLEPPTSLDPLWRDKLPPNGNLVNTLRAGASQLACACTASVDFALFSLSGVTDDFDGRCSYQPLFNYLIEEGKQGCYLFFCTNDADLDWRVF
jgi:hypothetical protein